MNNYFKKILILILSTAIYISCSDSSNPSSAIPFGENFTYPLKVGNKWNYERVWFQHNFRTSNMEPDLTKNDTTIYSIIEVTIDREEILADSIKTFVLTTSENQDNRNYYSEHYFNNLDDGLYNFAFKGISGSNSFPKTSQRFTYKCNELNFSSIKELSNFLIDKIYHIESVNSDSLTFYSTPIKSLKVPLEINETWNYVNNTLKIDKKVITKEFVNTGMGNFECYKIKWLYSLPNFEIYDYISSKGLLKRTMLVKNVIVTTSGNPDGNGYFDIKDEMILTGINF